MLSVHLSFSFPSSPNPCASTHIQLLIQSSRLLTRLQLIQVPPTNGQIALVLIHTPLEALHFVSARRRAGLLLLLCGLAVRDLSVLRLLRRRGFLDGRGCAAAAAEEAADGVADGGADCYAAGRGKERC